jgi:hypothetical protein
MNRPCEFSSFFDPVRFVSAQLLSSPPFPLLSAASPSADVATPLRLVTLTTHRATMSLMPSLNLQTTLRPVTSLLDPKPKH